ncbi:hypothetical protein D1007_15536 [Hordeum vulgare]|nr:hypothetical protein D1007_15536 [Hordeum vulgare]
MMVITGDGIWPGPWVLPRRPSASAQKILCGFTPRWLGFGKRSTARNTRGLVRFLAHRIPFQRCFMGFKWDVGVPRRPLAPSRPASTLSSSRAQRERAVLSVFFFFAAVEPPAFPSLCRSQSWPTAPPRRRPHRRELGLAVRSAKATSRRSAITGYCPRPTRCWCGFLATRPRNTGRGRYRRFRRALLQGFGLPMSPFFSEWHHFFGLQPHHLASNAILQLSAFVVLSEGFLGIEPHLDLWRSLFFFKQQSIAMDKAMLEKHVGPCPMTPCGAALVHHRSKSGFPQLPLQKSIKPWQKGFFYVKNADPARDTLNMPPLNINPLTKLN